VGARSGAVRPVIKGFFGENSLEHGHVRARKPAAWIHQIPSPGLLVSRVALNGAVLWAAGGAETKLSQEFDEGAAADPYSEFRPWVTVSCT
jgi:hypothetical protein